MFGTAIVLDGVTISASKNLRGLLAYGARYRYFRIKAYPCPKNPHNGRLEVEYENGATSSAFFRDYGCLLDWLTRRRNMRAAPFWDVARPAVLKGGPIESDAIARLETLGLIKPA